MTRQIIAVLMTASIAGCGGGEPKADEQPVEEPEQTAVSLEGSKCLGNRVPPTNYLQETAFVPADAPNASDEAAKNAITGLRDRICQGYRCNVIEPKITLWNTQADAAQVCAMAVVKGSEVDAFLEEPRAQLEAQMTVAGNELATALGKEKPVIAIDNVRDIGVDGGPRAEWLVDKMSAALLDGGAVVGKLPPIARRDDLLALPAGIDAIVSGRVTRLHGQESMLEVTWQLDVGNAVAASSEVQFPELIGPVVDPSTMMPDIDETTDKLALRFDTRRGGGLCAGQQTELFLQAGEPLHTRVVNLYGDGDQALLVHASKGKMKAKEMVSLGKVEVVPFADEAPVERFLVFGADEPSKLGRYEAIPVPCRIPSEDAKKLSAGEGIPPGAAGRVTTRSYRILDSEDCADFTADPASTEILEKFPMCW